MNRPVTMATARFGRGSVELAVEFTTSQYHNDPTPIEFYAPVRLSVNDLWAALWDIAKTGFEPAELENPQDVRQLVAGVLVNDGLAVLIDARVELARLVPGSFEHGWALELRDIVCRAFHTVAVTGGPAVPQRRPARVPGCAGRSGGRPGAGQPVGVTR